jgi:opacity protein-like surface antigen
MQAIAATSALADSEDADSSPGSYLQGAFVIEFPTGDITNLSNDNAWYGGAIGLGSFLTDWLALQARGQIISLGNDGNMTAYYTGDAKLYPFNLLRGHANGLLQPYGFAGLGGATVWGDNINTSTNFLFEVGAGLDLMFSRNFGLYGEFAYHLITIDDVGFNITNANLIGVAVGATYRF